MRKEAKMETNGKTVLNDTESNSLKKKDNKVLMGGIIAAVILVLAAGIGFGIYNSPSNRLSRQLDLGQKYLEEMDYEQAKIAFEESIAIDPMNTEAYLGAARAYAGLEDYEGAVAILQKGYEQTGDESLKMQLDEYEQKLAREKIKAEPVSQELETEILDYIMSIPSDFLVLRNNPIYTYRYLNEIYAEKLSQLTAYMKMDISDTMRLRILYVIHDCYLNVNDMGKAKECWTQCLASAEKAGYTDRQYEEDEYGRMAYWSDEENTYTYEYYPNSSLVKSVTQTCPCSSHEGYSDTWYTEYESYDEEGRILSVTMYGSCGYDAANASSLPVDYPVENSMIDEYTYTYDANSCRSLCTSTYKEIIDGSTFSVTGSGETIEKYDETGHQILSENYDESGKLISKIEYDAEGNVLSETSY